jgi:glycerol-3-phosphate dehydrogenase (NAD(P)+)
MEEVITDARIIVLAIPSQYIRHVLKELKRFNLSKSILLSAAKGIENKTLMRMSELIEEELGKVRLVVLSGPTIAYEVARGIPTTAVVSSKDPDAVEKIQGLFMSNSFRLYTNPDLIGVELGGSLKNIIAIAAGISDGLGFGTNTKAALLTRGLVEISRLGVAMGAKSETFSGISGLGDLVTTCVSPYSRNRFVGEEIAKGKKLKKIIQDMEMVAEGIPTTKSAYQLSKRYNVQMPITKEVYLVLYRDKNPLKAVNDLMTRERKEE